MRFLALLLALLLVLLSPAPLVQAEEILIVDQDGEPVSGAHLMCIDPLGEITRADANGFAVLDQPCRWARCDAARHLSSEVDVSRLSPLCRLRAGLRIKGVFPFAEVDCEDCSARLTRDEDQVVIATAAVHLEMTEAFRFPAVEPGTYMLEVRRERDGWVCRTRLAPSDAGEYPVVIDWQEDATPGSGVVEPGSDSKPEAGFGVWSCGPETVPPVGTGIAWEEGYRPRWKGRLRDSLGRQLAGGKVQLVRETALDSLGDHQVLTQAISDANGEFELPASSLPGLVIVAGARGHGMALVRQPALRAAGELVVGLPIAARARVTVGESIPNGSFIRLIDGAGLGRWREVTGREETFEDLAPGPGLAGQSPWAMTPFELKPGVLTRLSVSAGTEISGQVTWDGVPVEDAVVLVARPGVGSWNAPQMLTDAEGRFHFEGQAQGPARLVAAGAEGRADSPVELTGEGRIEVDLPLNQVMLDLQLRSDHSGPAPATALAWLTPDGEEDREVLARDALKAYPAPKDLSDADGRVSLSVPREGLYLLQVHHPSYEPFEQYQDLQPGRVELEAELVRRFARGLTIQIQADLPDPSGALLCRAEGRPISWQWVDGLGECENVPEGPVEVFFRIEGFGTTLLAVEMPREGRVERRLVVRLGGTLVVPVSSYDAPRPGIKDEQGTDWAILMRQIDPLGNAQPRLEEDAREGPSWVFHDLPYGLYFVEVGDQVREVVVVPGERNVAR